MPGVEGAEGTGRWVAARRPLALREVKRAGAETEVGTGIGTATGVGTAGAAATKVAQISTQKVPRALQQMRGRESAAKGMLRVMTVRRPSRPGVGCMCPAESVLFFWLDLSGVP